MSADSYAIEKILPGLGSAIMKYMKEMFGLETNLIFLLTVLGMSSACKNEDVDRVREEQDARHVSRSVQI